MSKESTNVVMPEGDELLWAGLEVTSSKGNVSVYNPEKPLPFEDLYFGNNDVINSVEVGDVVKGKILKVQGKDLVVDINYKDCVFVQIKPTDVPIIQNMSYGDEIDVLITEINNTHFEIKGSITELIKMNVSNKLRDCFKDREGFEATIVDMIPAGFMLDIDMDGITLKAFMPNTLAGVNRLTPTQSKGLLGKTINVMLESLQQEKGVYVVSRRRYLNSLIPQKIEELEIGTSYKGTVTGTIDYGIFVEFEECLTGMIHEVNINPEWKLADIKEGMIIEFYLRDIIQNKKTGKPKLILTQVLRETLWDNISVGQTVVGKVRSVKPYGALVTLDEETTGLIQNTYIKKSGLSLKSGQDIDVKVISVIKEERKIYLDIVK